MWQIVTTENDSSLLQMREALAAVMRSVRKLHGLPDGYLTPDKHAKFKSKEEQATDKAALHAQLAQKLANQMQLPPVRFHGFFGNIQSVVHHQYP